MLITLLITCYMLFDPAQWLFKLMELTYLSSSFKVFILILGLGNFALAYLSERFVFPTLARWVGDVKVKINPKWRKTRKIYKNIADGRS